MTFAQPMLPTKLDRHERYIKLGNLTEIFEHVEILDATESDAAIEFYCRRDGERDGWIGADRVVKCWGLKSDPGNTSLFLFSIAENGYYYASMPVIPLRNIVDRTYYSAGIIKDPGPCQPPAVSEHDRLVTYLREVLG